MKTTASEPAATQPPIPHWYCVSLDVYLTEW